MEYILLKKKNIVKQRFGNYICLLNNYTPTPQYYLILHLLKLIEVYEKITIH